MGGASSEVTASTTNVLIESAHFDPTTVARSSRRHRLTTEASKRFERGVDPDVTAAAAELGGATCWSQLGGGTPDAGVTDVDHRVARQPFDFDPGLPSRYVGLDYPREEVLATLRAIGCEVTEAGGVAEVSDAFGKGDVVSVLPPSWRPDLNDGPDLVEEVARVRGYDEIPSVLPAGRPRAGASPTASAPGA